MQVLDILPFKTRSWNSWFQSYGCPSASVDFKHYLAGFARIKEHLSLGYFSLTAVRSQNHRFIMFVAWCKVPFDFIELPDDLQELSLLEVKVGGLKIFGYLTLNAESNKIECRQFFRAGEYIT